MKNFVLIDPPITPYSSREEVVAWLDVCRQALAENPDYAEWAGALAEAERMLATA